MTSVLCVESACDAWAPCAISPPLPPITLRTPRTGHCSATARARQAATRLARTTRPVTLSAALYFAPTRRRVVATGGIRRSRMKPADNAFLESRPEGAADGDIPLSPPPRGGGRRLRDLHPRVALRSTRGYIPRPLPGSRTFRRFRHGPRTGQGAPRASTSTCGRPLDVDDALGRDTDPVRLPCKCR